MNMRRTHASNLCIHITHSITINKKFNVSSFCCRLLVLIGNSSLVCGSSTSQRLYEDLFANYTKQLRPVRNHSEAVNVTMQLWFMQILKVDEIDQILTIYAWVEEYWRDEFLVWNPSDYDGITTLRVPADNIWRPDVLVYNNADMNIHENEITTNVVLNHTGKTTCFRANIIKTTCSLDMKYFPFDVQHCHMMFASWTYDGAKVFLIPEPSQGNLDYYIENTEWKLLTFNYTRNVKYYSCCPEPFVDITYKFILERNPSYYTLNLIIPSILITIVTMVGFFTPYSSTGENTEKVSLGVTALLSLAIILLMVADKMPATSKVIPLIGKYYMGLIFLIFLAAIVTTGTLRLQSRGNIGKPLPNFFKHIAFDYVAKVLLMNVDIDRDEWVAASPANTKQLIITSNVANNAVTVPSRNVRGVNHVSAGGNVPAMMSVNGDVSETNFLISSPVIKQRQFRHTSTDPNVKDPNYLSGCRSDSSPGIWPSSSDRFLSPDYSVLSSSTSHGNLASPEMLPFGQDDDSHLTRNQVISSHVALSPKEAETELLFRRMRLLMDTVSQRILVDDRKLQVRKEWEQLARVTERLLMYVFIVGTVMFALFILHSPGPLLSLDQ